MFGTSHLYVFHHPAEMQSSSLKQADITYEMAQEEIAKNAGLDVDDQESKGDLGPFHSTSESFENTALFLWSGLPSTLIRHENEAFRKCSSKPEEFENASFSCPCGRKTF